MAIGNSHVGPALDGNSQSVGTTLDGNSQDVSTRPTSAEDKPTLDHLRRFGWVVWKHIPKSQRLDAKMGARAKACMMLRYVHDTTKIWRIWDPDFGKAVNCSDLYFDESQTAYISCMADNERSGDPLGLPEEEPVVTEVMEDSPEAENPDTAPEQESNPAAVLDTSAVTPLRGVMVAERRKRRIGGSMGLAGMQEVCQHGGFISQTPRRICSSP